MSAKYFAIRSNLDSGSLARHYREQSHFPMLVNVESALFMWQRMQTVAKLLRACVVGVFYPLRDCWFGRTLDGTEEQSLKVKILPAFRRSRLANLLVAFAYVNEISFMWKKIK